MERPSSFVDFIATELSSDPLSTKNRIAIVMLPTTATPITFGRCQAGLKAVLFRRFDSLRYARGDVHLAFTPDLFWG